MIILDDDHRGIFAFQFDQEEVEEGEGQVLLNVRRFKGKFSSGWGIGVGCLASTIFCILLSFSFNLLIYTFLFQVREV